MKFLLAICSLLIGSVVNAQKVSVKWELSDVNNLSACTIDGEDQYKALVTPSYLNGTNIAKTAVMTGSNASTDYTAVTYTPAFTQYYSDTKVTGKKAGYCVSFGVAPASGHKLKPTTLSFDAAKCGTDGGNFDVYVKPSGGTETALATAVSPLRNRVGEGNLNAYSHYEYVINDQIVEGKSFIVIIYMYNLNGVDTETPKAIALRNVMLQGVIDEEIFAADHYVESFTCKTAQGETLDLISEVKALKNGGLYRHNNKLYGAPTDFNVVCKEGYEANVEYSGTTATVKILKGGVQEFYFETMFTVTNREPKPAAKPLGRGLISVSLSGAQMGTGNLISWRHRENDDTGVKYKLFRGLSAKSQTTKINGGKYIIDKTNFRDGSGTVSSYYRLEVYDKYGNLLETEISGKTWANQSYSVPITAPVDTRNGALYSANDASFCDMDGDGEYEIILKWSPTNEKDAASSGTTSNPIFDCYKMDGTQLWRIDLGPNFFTSAHTIQFIAWDLDGDGYGEFMCKTAPGTVDGEGNYVIMGNDDPTANLLGSNGKQTSGPEYITVFDGMTGAELSTIAYHTNYAAGASYWGDSNQNRSERYLAALAYLDGYDSNPSPIFARGYYSGAFVTAYDFDGENLTERWVRRDITSGKGLWGEGAHWIAVADCDEDGKQEIIYGSAALDHDGRLLYRTGLGHGDALHVSDFITDRPGLEVLMCHEHKPYGIDIRDAKTGEIILRQEESDDTGRGLAAHFDSSQPSAQFLTSARTQMYNMADGSVNGESWQIGSSGAGINCRVYWDGDLYDEFFDKSIIAHWNPTGKYFDRYKFNNGNYLWGTLNNYSKNNPCVLGDILGDWREEIITHNGERDKNGNPTKSPTMLYINATSYESSYRIPHLMDDPQYRMQIVNQNCCYNQPPHLSFDPAVKYKDNPNKAVQEDEIDPVAVESVVMDRKESSIYTLQGVKIERVTRPGIYIINNKKVMVK